ncbi:hypothetical protein ACFV9E_11710 [Streptomyces sp. NPDC059835]|uniref:hypothetical protein n=1 Tax=Streptomyces sp. NPDC059835 TaxID=3346967 RepID=UPI00365FB55A
MLFNRKSRDPRIPSDLLVFLAVLLVVSVFVLVGHSTPQDLAGYATAATVLYAAWRRPQDGGPKGGR